MNCQFILSQSVEVESTQDVNVAKFMLYSFKISRNMISVNCKLRR